MYIEILISQIKLNIWNGYLSLLLKDWFLKLSFFIATYSNMSCRFEFEKKNSGIMFECLKKSYISLKIII